MTRDARKRWLTRIALVALAGLVGLGVWLRWGTQSLPDDAIAAAGYVFHKTGPLDPPATTNPNASLVVTEALFVESEYRTRVVRYDFKNGRVQPPETLWEGPHKRFVCLSWRLVRSLPLIGNRYLVSASGSVIDLQEKTLIHESAEGWLDARGLMEVRGDRIVSGVYNPSKSAFDRPVAFNLRTRVFEKLTDHETETITLAAELRGERSPDGLKSVVASNNSLTLYQVRHPPKELGTFKIGEPTSSGLWLDNEHFLTQDGNGNLLTVGMDGVRVPVVKVPVEAKDDLFWYLYRDADGRIIYGVGRERILINGQICYAVGRERFLINTEAKTWERCERTSSHGHGFESRLVDDQTRSVYRYKGTEILRSPLVEPLWRPLGPDTLTTESYITVWVGGSWYVWFAGTGEWTPLGEHTSDLAGWIK